MRKKQETVDNTINQGVVSIVTFLKKMSDDNDFMKNSIEDIRGFSEQEFQSIEGIATRLERYLNNTVGLNKKTKSDITNSSDLVKKLSDIESVVKDIYKKIGNKKAKQSEITSKKIDTSNVETLSNSLSGLSSNISRKTNVSLRRFIRLLNHLTSDEMSGKIKMSAASFAMFGKELHQIAGDLDKADKHMKKFIKGLTLFSLLLLSPMFVKSVEVFKSLMAAINPPRTVVRRSNNQATQWKWIFMTIALGIAALTAALIMLDKINWFAAAHLVGFLIAVSIAMFIGTRNIRNLTSIQNVGRNAIVGNNNIKGQKFKFSNNSSLAFQMMFLSIGLSILILAIDAIKEIDWMEAGKLVAFLLAIQTIMVVSALIIGKRGNINGGGMLGFAIGISLLLLAIDAGRELFQDSIVMNGTWDVTKWQISPVWGVVAFILLFATVLSFGAGRGSGGVAAHMLKFALGISILLIAIWAGQDLFRDSIRIPSDILNLSQWQISPVWGIVFFIIAITYAIGFSKAGLGSGGVAGKMIMFALGLSVLIAALVIAERELSGVDSKKFLTDASIITGTMYLLAYFTKFFSKMMKGIKRPQLMKDLGILALIVTVGLLLISGIAVVHKYLDGDPKAIAYGAMTIIGTLYLISLGVVLLTDFINNKKLTPKKIENSMLIILKSEGLFALGVILYAAIAVTQKYLGADSGKILGAIGVIFLTMIVALGLVIGVVYITKSMNKKDILVGMGVIAASIGMVFLMSLVYGLLAYIQRKGADNKKILGATQIMILAIIEVLALVAIIGLVASTGLGAIVIGAGVVFMTAITGVLLIAAAAMWLIMDADIQQEKIDAFKNSLKDLLLVFTEFSIGDIAMMMITSVALIPLVFSVALMAGTLLIIQSLNISEDNIQSFTTSVKNIFGVYTEFSLKQILKMAGTAIATLPLVLSAAAMAGVIAIISQIEYSESTIDLFTASVKKIFKAYSSFSLKEMLKMAGTAEAALPIALTALSMSQVFKNISEVDVSQTQIDRFTSMVIDFVKSFAQTMEETSEDALKKMKKSGSALVAIVDTAKGFVDVLIAIQGGQIGVYKVDERTGQPILSHFEKFDFEAVSIDAGKNLGKLMGDFASSFATNLELSNKEARRAKKASEVLQNLSPVFETISDIISDAEKLKVLTDTTLVNNITTNIDTFITKSGNSLKSLNSLDVKEEKFKLFKDFVSTFSDADKWDKSISAADRFGDSVNKVVKNINGLDLKKAVQFQGIIDSFTNMNNLKNLKEQIKEMTEMLKELNKYNENISESSLNIAKNTEQAAKNEEKTNELVGQLTKSGVTEESLYKIVGQLLTNAMTQIMSDISGNTYDVNVTNKVKVDTKNY